MLDDASTLALLDLLSADSAKAFHNILTFALLAPTLKAPSAVILQYLVNRLSAAHSDKNLEALSSDTNLVLAWLENAFERDFLRYTSWIASKKYDSAPAAALPPDQDMMQLLFKVSELLGSVPELLPLSNRLKLFLLKAVKQYRQRRRRGLVRLEEGEEDEVAAPEEVVANSTPTRTPSSRRTTVSKFLQKRFGRKKDDHLSRSSSEPSVSTRDRTHNVISEAKVQEHSGRLHLLIAERTATAQEVAIALTLLEERLFRGVKPIALIRMNWSRAERQKDDGIAQLVELAQRFNCVSFWAAKEVCSSPDVETRGVVLEFLMDVAQECLALGNFSSLMQIIGGLNNIAVSRMKRAWTEVLPEKLKAWNDMNALMESKANYRNYREAILQRAGTTPVIPFTGVLSRDITFIEEGNDYFVPNAPTRVASINLDKILMIADVLRDLHRFQMLPYECLPNEQLISYIASAIPPVLPADEDDILYSLSLAAEKKLAPEDWKEEKKRRQKRKTELVLATNIL